MSRNLIRDGYTRETTIKPVTSGLFEPLSVSFRPMLPAQHEEMSRAIDRATTGEAAIAAVCSHVAPQLATWSEVDEQNRPIPVTIENLRRLPPPLLSRLRSVVSGFEAVEGGDTLRDEQKN